MFIRERERKRGVERMVLTVADAHANTLDHDAPYSLEMCSPRKSVQGSGSMLPRLSSQSEITHVLLE